MLTGRVEGHKSADGLFYQIWQGETLAKSMSIEEARLDDKLKAAIKRNGWEEL